MSNPKQPKYTVPWSAEELTGHARKICQVLTKMAAEEIKQEDGRLALLLHGPQGVGKTRIAYIVMRALTANMDDKERNTQTVVLSGAEITAALVRIWMKDLAFANPKGKWHVTIINELDKVPDVAQVLMLEFLEKLGGRRAVIATSNESLDSMSARFTSRFQQIQTKPPTPKDISTYLITNWPELGEENAEQIAIGCNGDVRAACHDAQTHLDLLRFS